MATTYTLISSNVLSGSAASVTFSSIPSTYTDLVLRFSARTTNATTFDSLALVFNSDTSSIYSETKIYVGLGNPVGSDRGLGSNASQVFLAAAADGATSTSNTFSSVEFYIPNYTSSTSKQFSNVTAMEGNSTTDYFLALQANLYRNTSAITSINLTSRNAENFVSGSSFYLYGVKNS